MKAVSTFYYMYQIENKCNGKIYIGVHSTTDLSDGYMGSGILLKNAILKYGINNFEKTILDFFSTQEEAYKAEAAIVNPEFILRKDVYNIVEGGQGGGKHLSSLGGKASKKVQMYFKIGWYSRRVREAILTTLKVNKLGCTYNEDIRKSMVERAKSPKSIMKRKETYRKIGHQKKEKNSQFGTIWITNGVDNMKIKKEFDIPKNWWKGRSLK